MTDQLNRARSLIREIPNYPVPGIRFQDLTPLLADGEAFSTVIDELSHQLIGCEIVAGIEARGFIFGAALAHHLSIGFVPIRKKGKLPHLTHSQNYGLEYGQDEIQIHQDALKVGSKVLLVDDVLATGGTAAAAVTLVKKAGGSMIGFVSVLEIAGLFGREKLQAEFPHLPINTLFRI